MEKIAPLFLASTLAVGCAAPGKQKIDRMSGDFQGSLMLAAEPDYPGTPIVHHPDIDNASKALACYGKPRVVRFYEGRFIHDPSEPELVQVDSRTSGAKVYIECANAYIWAGCEGIKAPHDVWKGMPKQERPPLEEIHCSTLSLVFNDKDSPVVMSDVRLRRKE